MGEGGVQDTLMVVLTIVADSPVGGAAAEIPGKDNGQHERSVMDREMLTSSPGNVGTVMVWAAPGVSG